MDKKDIEMNTHVEELHDFLGMHNYTVPLHAGSDHAMICSCGALRLGSIEICRNGGIDTDARQRAEIKSRIGAVLFKKMQARYDWTFVEYDKQHK